MPDPDLDPDPGAVPHVSTTMHVDALMGTWGKGRGGGGQGRVGEGGRVCVCVCVRVSNSFGGGGGHQRNSHPPSAYLTVTHTHLPPTCSSGHTVLMTPMTTVSEGLVPPATSSLNTWGGSSSRRTEQDSTNGALAS